MPEMSRTHELHERFSHIGNVTLQHSVPNLQMWRFGSTGKPRVDPTFELRLAPFTVPARKKASPAFIRSVFTGKSLYTRGSNTAVKSFK